MLQIKIFQRRTLNPFAGTKDKIPVHWHIQFGGNILPTDSTPWYVEK